MNRLLVESATHVEPIKTLVSELGPDWQRYNDDVVGSELARAGAARGIMIDRGVSFEACEFPDDADERIRTRLGAEGARVEFTAPLPESPFDSSPITEIVLAAHMSAGIGPDDAVAVISRSSDGFEFCVGARAFQYNRFGVATG